MTEKDNRGWVPHKVHELGHDYNYSRKDQGKTGIETSKVYRKQSPGRARETDWSKGVDKQRSDYHHKKA